MHIQIWMHDMLVCCRHHNAGFMSGHISHINRYIPATVSHSMHLHAKFEVHVCKNEPRCEKTGLGGFRPGPTQTGL